MDSTPPSQLTSTTAPGKVFASRQMWRHITNPDYHKYNLKRREEDCLTCWKPDFQARLKPQGVRKAGWNRSFEERRRQGDKKGKEKEN
jgi:hypothetical protein